MGRSHRWRLDIRWEQSHWEQSLRVEDVERFPLELLIGGAIRGESDCSVMAVNQYSG